MNSLLQADHLSTHLASHALFRCADDAEETCWRVGQVFRPHRMGVLGTSQRLSAQMDHLRIGRMSFNRLSYGASVRIVSEPMGEFLMVFIPLSGVVDIRWGHDRVESTPMQAAVVSATRPLDMRWRSDCDVFILRIERSAVEEACVEQLGHALNAPIEFNLAMDDRSEGYASWSSLISFLANNAAFTRQAAGRETMAVQVESLVVNALLLGHHHTYSDALMHPRADAAPAYVRRAEDLMSRALEAPLTLEEIASQVGVSLRTLHAGFRKYRSASPMTALKQMRLDQVRAELLEAGRLQRPGGVAEIARAFGFQHLGHFAHSYLERFGERPSDTLRRHCALPLADR